MPKTLRKVGESWRKLKKYNLLVRLPVQLVIWQPEGVLTRFNFVDLTCCYLENYETGQ